MELSRDRAMERAYHTQPLYKMSANMERVSDFFGRKTFNLAHLRERLPKEALADLVKSLENHKKMSMATADAIASAVKEWALQNGATHYCHWFQPMTGLTAEKHDAFISIQSTFHSELRVIERFQGSQLLQGEPDASSFPSGGMRTTFEARGYTAWDPSSPFFILEDSGTRTLCIPSVFFGYHGQSLDMKIPLLRALESLNQHASEFLKLLGDVDVKQVSMTLGAEQEFFLIDQAFVAKRPDLMMTGRTLIGAPSPRGQQFEDHYFGSIPSRVKAFYAELERELFELGIPIKTRHNEVAPSQFELAPIFEDLNISVDHNLLIMDTMKRIARKHGLYCLLHEKPFAGINGSGKHCNWSLTTDRGDNLLEPGTTPHQNLRFLAMIVVVLKAVKDHAEALRYSIASHGNDLRLGANEAPPTIISVFLGSLLNDLLDKIESNQEIKATAKEIIDLGVSRIPNISKDYTDRNRTSPLAFTGNKFEFRAVGASSNPAYPMTMIAAALAKTFQEATQRLKQLIAQHEQRDQGVLELIREWIRDTKKIRFEGNGYSTEWREEAARRGLPIAKDTAEAIENFFRKEKYGFLVNLKVLSEEELTSHRAIFLEKLEKNVLLEAKVLLEITKTYVLPATEKTIIQKSETVQGLKSVIEQVSSPLIETMKKLARLYQETHELSRKLEKMVSEHPSSDQSDFKNWVRSAQELMLEIRSRCDDLERETPDEFWALPKYREMLLSLLHN